MNRFEKLILPNISKYGDLVDDGVVRACSRNVSKMNFLEYGKYMRGRIWYGFFPALPNRRDDWAEILGEIGRGLLCLFLFIVQFTFLLVPVTYYYYRKEKKLAVQECKEADEYLKKRAEESQRSDKEATKFEENGTGEN